MKNIYLEKFHKDRFLETKSNEIIISEIEKKRVYRDLLIRNSFIEMMLNLGNAFVFHAKNYNRVINRNE
jgi:hypothetical protein